MEAAGGSEVKGELERLQTSLENYFGMLNLLKLGLQPTLEEIHEKPPELIKLEMVEATRLPVWEGALQDQPHIWLKQWKKIVDIRQVFAALDRRNQNANGN